MPGDPLMALAQNLVQPIGVFASHEGGPFLPGRPCELCVEGWQARLPHIPVRRFHFPDPLAQAPEAAPLAFLRAEKYRVMFVGGVVHRQNQVPRLTGNPLMAAAVPVRQHAGPRCRLPPFAMRAAPPDPPTARRSSPKCGRASRHRVVTRRENAARSNPGDGSGTKAGRLGNLRSPVVESSISKR